MIVTYRDTDIKKAECLIKIQTLFSVISDHISNTRESVE